MILTDRSPSKSLAQSFARSVFYMTDPSIARSDVLGPNDAVSLALPTWAVGGQGVNAMEVERCRRRREGVKVDFQGWQRVMSVARRSEWAVGG